MFEMAILQDTSRPKFRMHLLFSNTSHIPNDTITQKIAIFRYIFDLCLFIRFPPSCNLISHMSKYSLQAAFKYLQSVFYENVRSSFIPYTRK